MPFVPAPNIVEVFMEHTLNNKKGVGWVLHYETDVVPWTVTRMTDLATVLAAWWNTEMKPNMNTSCSLDRIRMRELTGPNSLVVDYTTGLPIGGTLSGSPITGNVAFSLKKNTGLAGRSFRGRIYQFGFVETDTTLNELSAARANAYVAAWTEALFLTGFDADYGMVLTSKYSGGSPRASAISTDVTSISYADSTVDTRRDRL